MAEVKTARRFGDSCPGGKECLHSFFLVKIGQPFLTDQARKSAIK